MTDREDVTKCSSSWAVNVVRFDIFSVALLRHRSRPLYSGSRSVFDVVFKFLELSDRDSVDVRGECDVQLAISTAVQHDHFSRPQRTFGGSLGSPKGARQYSLKTDMFWFDGWEPRDAQNGFSCSSLEGLEVGDREQSFADCFLLSEGVAFVNEGV